MTKQYAPSKIVWHMNKLESFSENKIQPPVYVRVKPTNRCNHRCYYCAYDVNAPIETRIDRSAELPYEKMQELLDDFKDMGVKAVTYSGGGDPLIYPKIEEIFQKTHDYGISLSAITNGQRLNGIAAELLGKGEWVRVSIDSIDADTFHSTRGLPKEKFSELIYNLRDFVGIKSPSCILGINYVIQERNYEQVYDAIGFFREIGVDQIKLAPRHVDDARKYHDPIKEKVVEQIEKAKSDIAGSESFIYDDYLSGIRLSEDILREYNRCYIMETVPAISASGNVYPCHDKAWIGVDPLGSIMEQSFKQMWNSEETLKKIRCFDPSQRCRHHCTNDQKNKTISHLLRHPEDVQTLRCTTSMIHENFI
jgi:radical SAM protein with 4Fe4S-binding SPASM domain